MKIEKNTDRIPFKLHPRVFAALGADLVTNDVVALTELVKNAYDALAENVRIRLDKDADKGNFIEIADDGCGMSRDMIENVWCVVATPYKRDNPTAVSGKKRRRVSGRKGAWAVVGRAPGFRIVDAHPIGKRNVLESNGKLGNDFRRRFIGGLPCFMHEV